MSKYPDSIIDNDLSQCLICGTNKEIHIHHVFGGANRKLSTKYGLVVALCARHHTSNEGVHHNKHLNEALKSIAQQKAMKYYNWTTEEFIRIFGKNYIKE